MAERGAPGATRPEALPLHRGSVGLPEILHSSGSCCKPPSTPTLIILLETYLANAQVIAVCFLHTLILCKSQHALYWGPLKASAFSSLLFTTTRIMKSKGQRPFSSTRAIRVFWHFLHKIEYWVTLGRPLGRLNMSTGDHSCTNIFSK